jgi:hypothetical protein
MFETGFEIVLMYFFERGNWRFFIKIKNCPTLLKQATDLLEALRQLIPSPGSF